MTRARFALAGFATTIAVLVALAAGAPSAGAAGTCEVSDVHNTVRINGNTPQGLVTGGSSLNGTAGYAWFASLDTAGTHVLVGPDGSVVGPREAWAGEVVFQDVPFCETGTWTLVQTSTGLPVTRFETADDPAVAGPGTVDIDEPVDRQGPRSYVPGWVDFGGDSGSCGYSGPADVDGYPVAGTTLTEVSAEWAVDASASGWTFDEAIVILAADGETGAAVTSVGPVSSGSGELRTFVGWSAPSLNEVQVGGTVYDNGEPTMRCTATGSVLVSP